MFFSIESIGKISESFSQHAYTWDIDNFSCFYSKRLGNRNFSIRSGKFVTQSTMQNKLIDMEWQLELYSTGILATGDYLSLYLSKWCDYTEYDILFEFSIIDGRNEVLYKTIQMQHSEPVTQGFDKFISEDLLNAESGSMLLNDKLRIMCKIVINKAVAKMEYCTCDHQSSSYSKELLQNFEEIFTNGKFSDVKFNVNGKILNAHKSIVTSRSSVFAAMFDHEMQESTSNIVNIEDIDFHVFQEMLRFIYCGRVNDIEKVAKDLLIAADKYDIASLKSMCSECMRKCVAVDSAIEFFIIADSHDVPELKSKIKSFMIQHAKEIANGKNFSILKDVHGNLMMEIVRSMILQRDVK